MNDAPPNGAQSLIQTLVNGNVDVCFTNPGTSEMHFVAALDQVKGMRGILCLFEGVCTGAADGYARMTGKPSATLLHLGPGLGNGIANLHNARRAHVPLINVVGDHATYHLQYDAPLTSDIESLARPVSAWVRTCESGMSVPQDTADAIQAAQTYPGRVATLILPANCAWDESREPVPLTPPPSPTFDEAAVAKVAEIVRRGEPTIFLLSGEVLLEEGLRLASRLCVATEAEMMVNRPAGRIQRGEGRPVAPRISYPVHRAVKELQDFQHIILVGTDEPVAFFAYPNSPSRLAPEHAGIHRLTRPEQDSLSALQALCDHLNVPNQVGATYQLDRPSLPTGELTVSKIWQAVTALMPDETILVDESITAGRNAREFLDRAPRHDRLFITGGSIGIGLPLSVGSAVACPGRQVIDVQADGSAMYTVQALWTQARENLNCVTILLNNSAYGILQYELKKVGAVRHGNIADTLLNLDNPNIEWTKIANGMGVPSSRAVTADELSKQLAYALSVDGPYLIEVIV